MGKSTYNYQRGLVEYTLLTYFPYFQKMKVGLCDFLAVCVYVNSPPPPLTFERLN
jgi:hypothetical protein